MGVSLAAEHNDQQSPSWSVDHGNSSFPAVEFMDVGAGVAASGSALARSSEPSGSPA